MSESVNEENGWYSFTHQLIYSKIKSPLKRLKSFSRQEETFWALKDINFEVYPGEVVGIIGRNGAGKVGPRCSKSFRVLRILPKAR